MQFTTFHKEKWETETIQRELELNRLVGRINFDKKHLLKGQIKDFSISFHFSAEKKLSSF